MKRFRKLLLIVGGLLALSCALLYFVLIPFANGTIIAEGQDAASQGDFVLAKVAKDWDPMTLRYFASAEMLTDGQEEKRTELMSTLNAKFGAYQSGTGKASNIKATKDLGGDDALRADYTCRAKFEKGEAYVEMTLIRRKVGDWQVASFRITPVNGG